MRELLVSAATALRPEMHATETIADGSDSTPTELHATMTHGSVPVTAAGGIGYSLPEDGLGLSDAYSFTRSDTADPEANAVIGYRCGQLLQSSQRYHAVAAASPLCSSVFSLRKNSRRPSAQVYDDVSS